MGLKRSWALPLVGSQAVAGCLQPFFCLQLPQPLSSAFGSKISRGFKYPAVKLCDLRWLPLRFGAEVTLLVLTFTVSFLTSDYLKSSVCASAAVKGCIDFIGRRLLICERSVSGAFLIWKLLGICLMLRIQECLYILLSGYCHCVLMGLMRCRKVI